MRKRPMYYCTFCKGNHRPSSKIGKAHEFYALERARGREREILAALAGHVASGLGRVAP